MLRRSEKGLQDGLGQLRLVRGRASKKPEFLKQPGRQRIRGTQKTDKSSIGVAQSVRVSGCKR